MQSALTQKKIDVTNNLVSDYENEDYNMRRALELLKLYDVQIAKTRQAIDLLNSSYSNSGRDFEEVLRMEQQLLKINMSRSSAMKDFWIAQANLEYLTAKND